jgi:hypothetical protein
MLGFLTVRYTVLAYVDSLGRDRPCTIDTFVATAPTDNVRNVKITKGSGVLWNPYY